MTASPTPPTAPTAPALAAAAEEDSYLWLEEVSGEKALGWVKAQNEQSLAELATPEHAALKQRLLAIYDSKARIPHVGKKGKLFYNFWRDEGHVRGIWRRTTLQGYRAKAPRWETVLDIDALAKAENENWVYQGNTCLRPKYERCLLSLSRGGGDAVVVREFDTRKKEFIKDGFTLPEAKSQVAWKDEDTIFVGTDFGPGSLTSSGYPRIVKEWKRGTPLARPGPCSRDRPATWRSAAAATGTRGAPSTSSSGQSAFTRARPSSSRTASRSRWTDPGTPSPPSSPTSSCCSSAATGRWRARPSPRAPCWPPTSKAYRAGKRDLQMIYEPGKNHSLSELLGHQERAAAQRARGRPHPGAGGPPRQGGLDHADRCRCPGLGSYDAYAFDDEEDDRYWFGVGDFLEPARIELGDLKASKREPLKSEPTFFKSEGLESRQFFAVSKDGTRIPYFQVAKKDLPLDGSHPVLLTGYGGFEMPLLPRYDPSVGSAWLEAGGVYVVANIRGGGEYGPAWHQAGVKLNRQRVYDDFIAVAEDLIERKVTQPSKLGIEGGSNGGLLMGVMFTQRPDLWGAVVCSVPLLDMKRYHKLLAGASWMDEYGDPEKPEEWAAIARYSPYQNVKKDGKYPRILFTTSTRDDRVHPGHARKMVARMLEQGHDVLYYENTEGGHAGAANNPQRANLNALEYIYLKKQLMKYDSTMPLTLERVSKVVGGEVHLHPLDLELRAGGVNVVLGATLAGKTSLLRLMAGLDRPSAGRLIQGGRDVTGVAVRERDVAMVYQQFINYPSLTVFENIASPLRIAGRPARGDPPPGGGDGRGAAAHALPRAPPGRAVGRAAAADGPGPGPGQGRGAAAARRAAVQPGLQAARGAAGRAAGPVRQQRHHGRVRHHRAAGGPAARRHTPRCCTRAACCSRVPPSRCSAGPPPSRRRAPSPTRPSTCARPLAATGPGADGHLDILGSDVVLPAPAAARAQLAAARPS